jgi:putative tryptophan/tyrosine transport system substrate-binding protein
MRRIRLVLMFVLTASLAAEGQQAPKIPKIGLLTLATPAAAAPLVEAFRQELRALGYVEGKTFVLQIRYGEAKAERLRELARDLVALKMDVIVVAQDQAVAAVKREAGTTIPIVISNSSDPVGTGFVASLAHPGGNITGLSNVSPELSGKRLELLRQVLPGLSRVAFLLESRRQGQPARLQRNGGCSPFPACGASIR